MFCRCVGNGVGVLVLLERKTMTGKRMSLRLLMGVTVFGELRSDMLGAGSHHMGDVGVEGSGVGRVAGSHQSVEDD